ncbi:hypothetical protein MCC10091_2000 [Bifidobacterium longum subsp. longum]|nr:hypothetical protein MCC10091_2000 [Bifidobacterium longum subsp. longum]
MLIPSNLLAWSQSLASLSRRVNANSQRMKMPPRDGNKLIKKGEC